MPKPAPTTTPEEIARPWTAQWSPKATDPALPPITVITDPHDQPAYTTTALAAHDPAQRRISIHPTPLGTAPAYLAHDVIRALGKHIQPPGVDPPWWFSNADAAWRVTAAWTQALGIDHYIVCRAHRITSRHLEHLMALRELTRIRLTFVVSGPPPATLTDILSAVAHRQIDTLQEAHRYLVTDDEPLPPATYRWWEPAPFPPPDDEPWYQLPPRPRYPAGIADDRTAASRRRTATDRTPRPIHAIPLPPLGRTTSPSLHHDAIAQRIHTRIAHPLDAAAVAIRALTGYGIEQLPRLTLPSPQRPRATMPADLPPWARLLQDAARIHTHLERHSHPDYPAHLSGGTRPFHLSVWKRHEVAQASAACRLTESPTRRRTTRKRSTA